MEKLIEENKIKKNSYISFLNLENDKSNQDKEPIINDDIYLNIDSKNHFSETLNSTYILVNQKIENFNQDIDNDADDLSLKTSKIIKDGDIQKKDLTRRIMKKFLDKLYPECEAKIKRISYLILERTKKISKDKVEEYINYFFDKRYDLKYSTSLKFTKGFFTNCGYILCYIYSKLDEFILNKMSKHIENAISEGKNVLTDFYQYCEEKGEDPSEIKKSYVWDDIRKNYEIPPEIIFLLNIFPEINTLEFDLNLIGDNLQEEDFNLFTITILNIKYILPKLETINLNFTFNNLQYILYNKYYAKVLNIINLGKDYIKKNKIKHNYDIYNKKWDFEHDFNVEEYRKILIEKEKQENISNNIIYDQYSILYMVDSDEDRNDLKRNKSICNSQIFKNNNNNLLKHSVSTFNNDFEMLSNEDEEGDDIFQKMRSVRSGTLYINSNRILNSKKEDKMNLKRSNNQINNISSQISSIYNIILMMICGVARIDNIKKCNLVANDFYNKNIIIYLYKNFNINALSIDEQFHILDLFCNKIKKLDELNIEINSLNLLSFDKILRLIYKNQNLLSLKISLFSSDVSYFITTLLKTYEEFTSSNEINELAKNKGKYITLEILEEKIINDISVYFIENLNILFEIIKKKNNLEVLGLNFDLPKVLINNMNYKLPIMKFFLNILFLIDNNENKGKSKIKKLTLLSPHTILDNRLENNIDDLFKDIRIYKKAKILNELNIQTQFYNNKYVKNLISPNLIILSIGDLDMYTFQILVNYLTSYEFSSKSSLTNLNIKLQNKIIYFDTKIKLLMRQLFDIKIKTLLELKFFSNIMIRSKSNYFYLIKILKNNWIPSYVIALNQKSKILNKNIIKDVDFLVSKSIENKVFNEYELSLIKKDKNEKVNDSNDEVFWMLKYIFYFRYSHYYLNFIDVKNIIFGILKYLYFTSKVKLTHDIFEAETL